MPKKSIEEEDAESVEAVEEPGEEEPDPGKHILVDFGATGDFVLRNQPEGWSHDRRLLLEGQNVEHVSTTEHGVWQYRKM